MADDRDDETPDTRTEAQIEQDRKDLEEARDEFKLSYDYFSDQRDKEIEDLTFEAGQHWTEAELQWKRDRKEPAFVIDMLSGPINKTANTPVPRAVVSAVGEGADPQSAEYWQGLVRRVENLSGADGVYKWARLHAIKMGRGFFRVRADYFAQVEKQPVYQTSIFDQDVRLEPILNQHSVFEDPRPRLLDFSDMRFCFIAEDVEWSEFTRRWPKARHTTQAALLGVDGLRDWSGIWSTAKRVQVAERYYIVDEELTLCLLHDGTVVEKAPGNKRLYPPEAVNTEHTFQIQRVKWMRFTAAEVLERADVHGRYIPVIKIVGERRLVEGKEDNRGMVRMARGPQRLVNFMESRLAKAVDEDSFSTIMADADSIAHDPKSWENIHLERPAVVTYKAISDIDGKRIDKPEILQSAPNIAAISVSATRASMSLRATLGVPDVTPEELRPEQSGVAIDKRNAEQAQTTSHYADSLESGVRLGALIIMSMGREVWTMPRIMRIVGKDEQPAEVVTYNGPQQLPMAQQKQQAPMQPGATIDARHLLDLSITEYDVTVTAGKGYQSGREETVAALTPMVQLLPPPIQPKAIAIILKNSDFPGAQELAAALEPDTDGKTVPVEQAQKAQMVIDALTEQVNALKDEVDNQDADRQSKERIEAAKIQAGQAETQAKLEADLLLEERKFHHELELKKLELAAQMKQAEMAHEREMESMTHGFAHERAIGAESAARDRAHGNGSEA